MSYTIESLDDGHILVQTFGVDFDMTDEMPQCMAECIAFLDASPNPVVMITDSRNIRLGNIDAIIKAANASRSEQSKRLTQHPKLVKSLTITSSKVGHMAIKGLNSAAFGHLEIPVFETMEQALQQAAVLLGREG